MKKSVAAILLLVLQTVCAFAAADLSVVNATKSQDWADVETLLKSAAVDVDAAQPDGATALAWSAYWNNVKTAKLLLRSGADASAANDYGVTPLYLACQNRSLPMVKALLAGGADPESTLWNGVTPLMVAAQSGRADIVRALLDAGADVDVTEPRRGQNALMWAIAFGHPAVAQDLIQAGADVTARTTKLNEDFDPMYIEAYTERVPSTPQGGYTALMFAARAGDAATVQLLLDRGADVNAESAADGSPLVIASSAGHEELALQLLDAGADPMATDAGNMTALHYAFRDGLKLLHGYNVSDEEIVCNFGGDPTRCKPLSILSEPELAFLNSPTTDLFLGEEATNLREPMQGRNMHRLAEALLNKGADPNAAMQYPPPHLRLARLSRLNLTGATPFFLAAAAQDIEATEMMLTREDVVPLIETSVNEENVYKQSRAAADDNEIIGNATSLMVALGMGRKSDFSPQEEEQAIQVAEKLIARGADVNQASATGWTPMHAAAYIGANGLIEYLGSKGAAVNVMTGCGQTPMTLALGTNVAGLPDRPVPQVETAELLLELGATHLADDAAAGICILGRGGLAADVANNELVKERIAEVERKLQARQ